MAVVLTNKQISPGIFILKIEGQFEGAMGQFYMLRGWTAYPLLSRPISIYDIEEDSISFMYHLVGVGTSLLSELKSGNHIQLEGPYGNGYPKVDGKLAIVGGGIGIAPLLLAAKEHPHADIFLGFSEQAFAVEAFESTVFSVTTIVGRMIVDFVNPHHYDTLFACGPLPMLEALAFKAKSANIELYFSTEKRMACGIGACLTCTMITPEGNRRVCKEGPVFKAEEVNFSELYDL